VGASVVDLACASTSLYRHVQSFRVLPYRASASKDHCGLCVSLTDLPRGCHEVHRRGRRCRVYRPTSGSGYTSALMRHTDSFQAMLQAWESGGVSVECALRQFTEH
jgi:hypothetical protein